MSKNKILIVLGALLVLGLLGLSINAIVNMPPGAPVSETPNPLFGDLTVTPSGVIGTVTPLTGIATPQYVDTPSAVAGLSCGWNCVWSAMCVNQGYTWPEQAGLTRVHPDSCIPLNPVYWRIDPNNPFAGMPCSTGTVGSCVWSRQCVENGRVPAVRNGLAPVTVGSCLSAAAQ